MAVEKAKRDRREYNLKWSSENAERKREYQRKWRMLNKDKIRAWDEKFKAENPTYYRDYRRRKRFDRVKPTRPCPEVCECCGKDNGPKVLCVDHDHDTGAFRGWLCTACNRGIGSLGDDLLGLERARAYLIRAKES